MPEQPEDLEEWCPHWTIDFESKCVDCGKQFVALPPLDDDTAAQVKKAFGSVRRFKIINPN